MNRVRIGALLTALSIFALLSCENQLLTKPYFPSNGSTVRNVEGLTASHGEKQSITLSWNQNSDAALYYIYKADSPLDDFVRCGEETSNTQHKFSVSPGTTVYYRVSFVSRDGRESSQSMYVRGTSLAQPFISDITDKNESSVTVTWYMDNVSDDTYKGSLLYTVYCFNGSTEVAQIALDGSTLAENKATFNNLSANAEYEFRVEAYLRSDQSASEKSDKVNAATARRMRPAAPDDLLASHGTAKEKIELTFKLPEMVDIAIGENQYDQKPVYFKISKRLYSASGHNEYQTACLYFGSIEANKNVQGGESFNGYTPGAVVTWTDNTVSRGVEYEYQVQAYVDDTPKVISSDSSKASARGWALSEGTLSFGDIDYTTNESGSLYTSAQLPLVFDFDPKNIPYDYSLVEKVEPIGDGEDSLSAPIKRQGSNLTYDGIRSYVARMNLEQPTSVSVSGRGVYSYEVEIKLNGEPIDTVATIGQVEVSENTDPIIVEGFSVQDGYTDKFVLKWHYHENRKYELYESNDRINWTQIPNGVVNPNPVDTSTVKDVNYSYTYTSGITSGLTKYFAIKPYRNVSGGTFKQGQMVYASSDKNAGFKTLGIPVLSLVTEASYSTITATWTEAQKADTYRIKYWYSGEGNYNSAVIAAEVNKDDLGTDASGKLLYKFMPFINNAVDAAKAGKEIQVAVDALNVDLQTKVGGGEISTKSNENAKTQLVGPALLAPSASHAVSPTQIDVSWNKIDGANGYYVFRRQFNMNNTAEEGTEPIAYYVPEVRVDTASIAITGKELNASSGTKEDTSIVKAAASFANSRYTLKDIYMNDDEYNGSSYGNHTSAYRNQQNNMAQGFSYRYYVVPVVNRGGAPEPLPSINFVYSGSNISYYTIRENGVNIRYNGAAAFEKDGFTIGFGQNVTATKGTYTSNPTSNYPTNNGIQITWSAPPRLAQAGITPVYEVYRKAYNATTWDRITTVNTLNYLDSSASLTKGIAYEYLIGISNGSSVSVPKDSARFIESCRTMKDEKGRSNMLGYMLEMVKMESVSRNEQKVGDNFAEEVKWFGAGVKSSIPDDYRWGIDGYTVFVMNRNIDANWHVIADIPYANIANQTNLSTQVTNTSGLLKVLRDYKHYFKVRSYALNNVGEKIYSSEPEWNYETLFAANRNNQDNANFLQTDYVKWGARQITPTEFTKVATLFLAWGIHTASGDSPSGWTTRWSYARWYDTNGNNGSSGRIGSETSFGVGKWWFYLDNYKPDLDTNANRGNWTYSTTFVTIHGSGSNTSSAKIVYADSDGTSQFPNWYGRDGNYGSDYVDIKGPACVSPMYTGQLRFGNSGSTNLNWSGGFIEVKYPAGATATQITNAQANTPLPFKAQESTFFGSSKRTSRDEWY